MQQRVLATSIVCLVPTDRSVLLSALRDELRPDLHTCEAACAHRKRARLRHPDVLWISDRGNGRLGATPRCVWMRSQRSSALEMSRLFGNGARLSATRRRTAGWAEPTGGTRRQIWVIDLDVSSCSDAPTRPCIARCCCCRSLVYVTVNANYLRVETKLSEAEDASLD